MKIKRFFAADIRQAIRQVRDELGPDAVILSNRRVNGGVEIVSAIDYDAELLPGMSAASESPATPRQSVANRYAETLDMESIAPTTMSVTREPYIDFDDMPTPPPAPAKAVVSNNVWSQEPTLVEMRGELKTLRGLLEHQLSGLAWGDMARRHPQQAMLLQKLMKLGLSASLARKVVEQIPAELIRGADIDALWRRALGVLAHSIPASDDDVLAHGGIVALVGPTGVGKTTTVAKLAARYALRHGARQVALVTTDNYRIGAHDQLRAYGRILDIPVRVAGNREELQTALADLSDRRLILIDTAGMGQRDQRLTGQFAVLNDKAHLIKTYLVLSTTTRLSGLQEIVQAFHGERLDGCILTKLDETTSLGSALSVVVQRQLPIAYISDGQRVPEDLHIARAHTVVSRAVVIMQQSSQALEEESMTLAPQGAPANVHV